MIRLMLLAALLLMPGCATTGGAPVATDSFCITAKKRKWSVHDRPEAVREARVWNQIVDRRCGIAKGAAA
jgi:hypothetical protein